LSTDSERPGQSTEAPLETWLAPAMELPTGARTAPVEVAPEFDDAYEDYFVLVWRTARRLGVPEAAADDVVQDVFLVVHRRLADYDGRTPFKYWLLGIAARVVADHRRTFRRKDSKCVPHPVDPNGGEVMASPNPAPYEQAEQAEALRLVVTLLDELDEDKREVLVLSEFEQMSAVEIAECLTLNINTVYGRLRAARHAFDAAYARHRARSEKGRP
jgi:RNA polymerase sigma-70 factor, ECF subfamily